ncbi:hypothetical protein C0L77_000610 [Clostridium perfringens]|nr:hypothetical protein CYK68_14575 [Clostridium perfringens]PWX14720.1 hypothetical protein CYK66_14835 [Clostridium perfringens]
MNISGWAFAKNADELRDERYNRFKELNKKDIKIESVSITYARKTYKGTLLNKNLSDLDILLLCDDGNTCFGGYVSQDKDKFVAAVYTD